MHCDGFLSFGSVDKLEIEVCLGQVKNTYVCRPQHCGECRSILWVASSRQNSFIGNVLNRAWFPRNRNAARDEFDVKLVFHVPADLVKGQLPAREESPTDYMSAPSDTSGLRRSVRTTRGRTGISEEARVSAHRRWPTTMELRRDDTLKTIRMRIAEAHKIPIMVQRIWFNGREIENADETIQTIGIIEGGTLQVIECSNEANPVDLCATDEDDGESVTVSTRAGSSGKQGEDGRKGKKKRSGRVEGFGGTGLQGFDDGEEYDEMGLPPTSRSSRSSESNNTPAVEDRSTDSDETRRVDSDEVRRAIVHCTQPQHAQNNGDLLRKAQEELASRALAEQLQAEENAQQNGSARPKPQPGRKQCRVCTYDNHAKNTECEMCQNAL